jgi:hypothetical protein
MTKRKKKILIWELDPHEDRHRFDVNPDPDRYQNDSDPEHWVQVRVPFQNTGTGLAQRLA